MQGSDNKGIYFDQAKKDLEILIQSKEKLKYEQAIFIIENAWYDNSVNLSSFKKVIDYHAKNVEKLIKSQYNYKVFEEKALAKSNNKTLSTQFLDKLTINETNYRNAIGNYAIYNYIKKPLITADTQSAKLHKPYEYSHNDPKATIDWENSQVIHLNNTHIGNCFALASFFKILSDRIGSEAHLCTAPNHIYIRHADPEGRPYNIELGTTAFPRMGQISTITYSTEQAVKNHIAQQELSEIQTLALCFVYLAKSYEFKYGNSSDVFILECAETALKYDSKCLNAMLLKAEYLENQILNGGDKTQIPALEEGLIQLYDLGYREMPLDMKNLLVKMYLRDTISQLQLKTYSQNNSNQTRYASLSWGLFDERHESKPIERYGNALFGTKAKRIVEFKPEQSLYNGYNFDPVIFALQVDPLAHKFPSLSPYHSFLNNPINVIDPDGREGIVISGQPGNHSNREHFLLNGLDRASNMQSQYNKAGNNEQVTWFIYSSSGDGGYDAKTLANYMKRAAEMGISAQIVTDANDIVDYVNDKSGDGSRAKDLVSKMTYVGHATPGDLDVGYIDKGIWNSVTNDKIEPSSFKSSAFGSGAVIDVVGGCRTAVTGDLPLERSVIDQFADKVDAKSTIRGSDVRVGYMGGIRTNKQLVDYVGTDGNKVDGNIIEINGRR
jgi:hypothetical protein